jgi:acetyltransferase-like isoleucine patch superfamily enzyme
MNEDTATLTPGESAAAPAAAPASPVPDERPGWYRYLATSDRPLPRLVRRLKKFGATFSVPAPRIVFRPILLTFLAIRWCYYFALRVFVCEPLFKAYCKQYGRGLRTGTYLHWVSGRGDIVLGDNVWIDGKSNFRFAARFSDQPTLQIGDNTAIGHDCFFTVARQITIGRNCNLSGGNLIFDSNGHPSDPAARLAGKPPSADDIRPVVIADNVWIGARAIILPGVKIGEGSVIAAGSVVRSHVPPFSVVAGNPARVLFRLKRPEPSAVNDQR